MNVVETAIPEVRVLTPRRFGDDRGFFSEIYNARTFAEAGIDLTFVQDNLAYSAEAGVLRGLHFQIAPFAQDKLIRVIRGAIHDVAVDLRRFSPTYGRHVAVRLDADSGSWVLVPVGFAHGYCTLEPDTLVLYKVTALYAPDHERGVIWNDPALGIDWPLTAGGVIVSDKDRRLPPLRALGDLF